MQIELKVEYHLSGRFTLKRRDQNDMSFKDFPVGGLLFGNDNAAKFYRAVAQEIANLAREGHEVEYRDVQSLDDFPTKAVAEFAMGSASSAEDAGDLQRIKEVEGHRQLTTTTRYVKREK